MKLWRIGLVFCLAVGIGLVIVGCDDDKEVRTEPGQQPVVTENGQPAVTAAAEEEEPLLLLEEEEPLLLLDEGDGGAADGPMIDNSRCHVCHMNYDGEDLSVIHAKAEIGCEDCHGASDAHCADEDNITPPDRIFATDAIVPYCTKCHSELKPGEVPAHEEVLSGKKVCTDCHGEHRLGHRTRRWDKKTRELIEDDKVRMLTDEMLGDSN